MCTRTILKNRINCNRMIDEKDEFVLFFKIVLSKTASTARN